MNPYVFLVGCARSGTTLLKRIVDAHPEIAIVPGGRGIVRRYQRREGLTPSGDATAELAEHGRIFRFLSKEEYPGWIEAQLPTSYAELVTRMFDEYGRAQGKPHVGHKVASSVREIPTLHELWPRARYVHIIRDGRDVLRSALNWRKLPSLEERYPTWKDDPIATGARWWEEHVRAGREAGAALEGSLYHEIRYEELVADPEGQSKSLCAFLGVGYDQAMLQFHEGREREGDDAKHAWKPITTGLRDWRTEMTPEDAERFKAAAGGLLEELGY